MTKQTLARPTEDLVRSVIDSWVRCLQVKDATGWWPI
jgi:hypothetical protein